MQNFEILFMYIECLKGKPLLKNIQKNLKPGQVGCTCKSLFAKEGSFYQKNGDIVKVIWLEHLKHALLTLYQHVLTLIQ